MTGVSSSDEISSSVELEDNCELQLEKDLEKSGSVVS
jgi:hypothetical protein